MKKKMFLKVEDLEERIAPGFIITPDGGPTTEVTEVNAAKGSAAFLGTGEASHASPTGANTAWNAHATSSGPIGNL
jgi:hypothetical protein